MGDQPSEWLCDFSCRTGGQQLDMLSGTQQREGMHFGASESHHAVCEIDLLGESSRMLCSGHFV